MIIRIQILIFIKESLAAYYQKVKGENHDLIEIIDLNLDFRHCCPIPPAGRAGCGGADCAIFIEYYVRMVIDEHGTYFKEFPIARYRCQGKGQRELGDHRTFSLLPYQLVPYSRYSIPFIIKAMKARYQEGLSIVKLQDYLANFGTNDILSISASQLLYFKQLVLEAVHKITASGHYQGLDGEIFSKSKDQEILVAFLEFAFNFEYSKIEPSIRGPCGLGYDYYLNEGGFLQRAHFLFGTPSQFR